MQNGHSIRPSSRFDDVTELRQKLYQLHPNSAYSAKDLIELGFFSVDLIKDTKLVYKEGKYLGAQILHHFSEHNGLERSQYDNTISFQGLANFFGISMEELIKLIGKTLRSGVQILDKGKIQVSQISYFSEIIENGNKEAKNGHRNGIAYALQDDSKIYSKRDYSFDGQTIKGYLNLNGLLEWYTDSEKKRGWFALIKKKYGSAFNDEDIEDLMQDVYEVMHRNITKYGPVPLVCSNFTYIARVTHNYALNKFRIRKYVPKISIDEPQINDDGEELSLADILKGDTFDPEVIDSRDKLKAVYGLLGKKNPKWSIYLEQAILEGLSYEEVAQRNYTTKEAVKSVMFRVHQSLREGLQKRLE